jgi:pyruvate dehydrogenase E1 component alpha subunit
MSEQKLEQTSLRTRAAELGFDIEDLLEMLSTMCTIRHFEKMADKLYGLGKVHGTMHLCIGQEAVAVGEARALHKDDYLINHHRGHGHFIAHGANINLMMAEFLGKATGYCAGRGGSMHIADLEANNLGANGIVAGGIPLAVGVGLALQMQRKPEIVLCLFGDGASNEGVFHEALNMAALWKLPILFLCENNHYGMSMEVARSVARLPIAQRADAYGIPWQYVDGNDVLAVYEAVRDAAGYVRGGNGPAFVETETYRWMGHSKSDRNLYRTKEEIEEWKQRDPIACFRDGLIAEGVLDQEWAEKIDQDGLKTIEAAVAFAEASPEPDASTVTDWVYA